MKKKLLRLAFSVLAPVVGLVVSMAGLANAQEPLPVFATRVVLDPTHVYCSPTASCIVTENSLEISGYVDPDYDWHGPGVAAGMDLSAYPSRVDMWDDTLPTLLGIRWKVDSFDYQASNNSVAYAYLKSPFGLSDSTLNTFILDYDLVGTFGSDGVGLVYCLPMGSGTASLINFDNGCDVIQSAVPSYAVNSTMDVNAFHLGFFHGALGWLDSLTFQTSISDIEIVYMAEEEIGGQTQMPNTHPGGGGGVCVFTNTLTFSDTNQLTTTLGITTTDGITITTGITESDGITATIPYTRNINLVSNGGFESGGPMPTDWDKYLDGVMLSGTWDNLVDGVGWDESRAAQSNGGAFDFLQDVSLNGDGADYAMGFYARCVGSSCSESASVYWGQMTLAGSTTAPTGSGSPSSSDYVEISGTKTIGTGAGLLTIKTTGTGIYVDDVFLYAVDGETGAPLCDPSLFAPPTTAEGGGGGVPGDDGWSPSDGVAPIGGIPAPIGGAGSSCYNCFTPQSVNQSAVSYWIAWLGCVIRNMFSCSLRVWLLVVGNWIKGNVEIGKAFLVWIPATMQSFVNWVATQVVPGIRVSISVATEPATNLWDVLVALIQVINTILGGMIYLLVLAVSLVGDLIGLLASAILGIIRLLIELVGAVRIAFSVEPIAFDLNGISDPGTGGGAGPTPDKMLWLFLAFLGLIDKAVIGNNLGGIFAVALAALAIGVIVWTFSWWQDLLSF